MAEAYQYTADGYYAEKIEDYGLLPNNATHTAPVFRAGFIPRWTGAAWEQVEDHKGEEGYVDGQPHTIKDYGPYPAGWSKTLPPPTLEKVKIDGKSKVDNVISAAIMAGFEHEIDADNEPETLHFSYDAFDQQNFADSAIAMQLGAAASDSPVPTSTPWNAYRNWSGEEGELVVLHLTAATFLPLYTAALKHKAEKMAEGGSRKAQIEAAGSVEAVQALLAEWGL